MTKKAKNQTNRLTVRKSETTADPETATRVEQLLRRVGAGDETAIDPLLQILYPSVRRMTAASHTWLRLPQEGIDDTTQAVIIILWKALRKGTTFRNIQAWLAQVVKHHCFRKAKTMKMRLEHATDPANLKHIPEILEKNPAFALGATDAFEQLARALEHAMAKLSPREQTAFRLVHLQKCSRRKAAGIMQISEGTLDTLMHRARQKLKTDVKLRRFLE